MELTQKATLWRKSARDKFGGTTYLSPEIIDCEWFKKSKIDFSKNGKNLTVNYALYNASDVQLGDYIALSTETDLNPTNGAYMVIDLVLTHKTSIKVAYL